MGLPFLYFSFLKILDPDFQVIHIRHHHYYLLLLLASSKTQGNPSIIRNAIATNLNY